MNPLGSGKFPKKPDGRRGTLTAGHVIGAIKTKENILAYRWLTYVSRTLVLSESLTMIGKLLGHTQVQTTARYAHLARDTVKASAALIGDSIERDLEAAD